MSPPAALSLLKAVPYFADVESNALKMIADRARPKAFAVGQQVFLEGETCRHLCLLDAGRVKFFRTSADGREQILKVFERRADTFCIASAFGTGVHIVSAAATTETRLYLLEIEAVRRLAQAHPSLGLKLVAAAGEHMTHLVGVAGELSLKSVTERLAKHLLDIVAAQSPAGSVEISLDRTTLPEEELASMLGTVRVHVSRSFSNLARAGAIAVDRRSVRIRDLAALRRIAEGSS